jgi:hypothetical protein
MIGDYNNAASREFSRRNYGLLPAHRKIVLGIAISNDKNGIGLDGGAGP